VRAAPVKIIVVVYEIGSSEFKKTPAALEIIKIIIEPPNVRFPTNRFNVNMLLPSGESVSQHALRSMSRKERLG